MNQYDNSYYDSDNEVLDPSDQFPDSSKHTDLFDIVDKLCETTDKPLNIKRIVDEYKQAHGLPPASNYLARVLRRHRSKIQNSEALDTNTKVRQLFGYSAPMSDYFLQRLRNIAFVEVDNRKRITKYIAKDGSLRLEGAHDSRSKQKQAEDPLYVSPAPKKRRENYYEEISQDSSSNDQQVYVNDSPLRTQQPVIREFQEPEYLEPKYEGHRFMNTKITPAKPTASAAVVQKEDKETILLASQKKLLENMEALISTYFTSNDSLDSNILRQIGEGIDKIERYQVFGVPDEDKLKVEDLLIALESCFLMLRKSASVEFNEESKSLRDFLLLFRMTVVSMHVPALNDFQLKLVELTDELSSQDKKVSLKKMKSAIENLIEMIVP